MFRKPSKQALDGYMRRKHDKISFRDLFILHVLFVIFGSSFFELARTTDGVWGVPAMRLRWSAKLHMLLGYLRMWRDADVVGTEATVKTKRTLFLHHLLCTVEEALVG
jgi:hypothetical protein